MKTNDQIYNPPYLFSSAPGIGPNLNIAVKRVPDSIISNYIADYLKVKDVVEVLQSMGDFFLENKNISVDSHLIFWGAGGGIMPLFSMINYTLKNHLAQFITLVYGNRAQGSAIFYKAINQLQKQYFSSFTVK